MKRAATVWFAVLGVVGCAPSMHDVLAENHFREATCAVRDGSGQRSEIMTTMTRALDPQLHVEVMSDETIAAAVPNSTPELRARAFIIRVQLATNEIPIDHLDVALDVSGDASVKPMEMNALAALTGERVPPSHSVTTTHTLENIVRGGLTIMSLGILDPGLLGPTTHMEPPTTAEWEEAAPIAARFFAAFPTPGCSEQRHGPETAPSVSRSCDEAFLVERRGSGSLAVDVGLAYEADRYSRDPETRQMGGDEESWKCRTQARLHVPLGPVASLPQATATTFGARFRSAAELGRIDPQ